MFEIMFLDNYGYHHLRIIYYSQHTIRRGAEKGMKQHSLMLERIAKVFLFFLIIQRRLIACARHSDDLITLVIHKKCAIKIVTLISSKRGNEEAFIEMIL